MLPEMAAQPVSDSTPEPDSAPGLGAPLSDLSALYEEHFDMVWRFVSTLGVEPSVRDDAVQDVFLVAHRRADEFQGRSTIKTWLFGIAHRVASNYRRSSRRQATCELPATLPSRQPDQEQRLQAAEAALFIQRFLDTLSEGSRAAFIACVLEEMTVPEASQALRVNPNTLYSRVRVARARFVAALIAKGIRS